MSAADEYVIGALLILVVVMIALAVLARIYIPYRRRRNVWTFRSQSLDRPKIIIESVAGGTTSKYRRPSAGFGLVDAVAQLTTALNASRGGFGLRSTRSLYRPIELWSSADQQADGWCSTQDTVVLGGPKHNDISAEALRAFGCQPPVDGATAGDVLITLTENLRGTGAVAVGLGLATRDNTIYWFGKPCEGNVSDADTPPPGTSPYEGIDYGVVLRLPSPKNPKHRMVVIFGSQTFGVQAASAWLVNAPSADAQVRRMLARHRNVAVLVEVKVHGGQVDAPTLVEIVPLPDDLQSRHR